MANVLYRKGAQRMMAGEIGLSADTIVARLVDNSYEQDLVADEFLSSVPKVTGSTDKSLANKSITNGVFDADDITFTAVPSGATSEGIVLAKWTGNDSTSPLIAYIDTITGFPLNTNNGDVVVQWDNSAYKIFTF